MPGPAPKPEGRRQRRNKRRVIWLEPVPACVVCGGVGAPFCSRRCERRLAQLGGPARAAEQAEDAARHAVYSAEAAAWRRLAAQLRAIADR